MKLNKYAREVFGGKGGINRFFSDLDGDITELHRRVDSLFRQKAGSVWVVVAATPDITKVNHGLGRKPVHISPVPRSDARVWQTGPATDKYVFLSASVKVMVDLYV